LLQVAVTFSAYTVTQLCNLLPVAVTTTSLVSLWRNLKTFVALVLRRSCFRLCQPHVTFRTIRFLYYCFIVGF